jgi:hypothetical protein
MATVINTENMQCLVSWPEHNTTIMQNTNGTGKVKKVKTQEGYLLHRHSPTYTAVTFI